MNIPTHKLVDGVRVDLSKKEIQDHLDSWKKSEEEHKKIAEKLDRKKMLSEKYPDLHEEIENIYKILEKKQ